MRLKEWGEPVQAVEDFLIVVLWSDEEVSHQFPGKEPCGLWKRSRSRATGAEPTLSGATQETGNGPPNHFLIGWKGTTKEVCLFFPAWQQANANQME